MSRRQRGVAVKCAFSRMDRRDVSLMLSSHCFECQGIEEDGCPGTRTRAALGRISNDGWRKRGRVQCVCSPLLPSSSSWQIQMTCWWRYSNARFAKMRYSSRCCGLAFGMSKCNSHTCLLLYHYPLYGDCMLIIDLSLG